MTNDLAVRPHSKDVKHADSPLPTSSPEFLADARKLFSLDHQQLKSLVEGLHERQYLFSTHYVAKTLKTQIEEAETLRGVFLFLMHALNSHEMSFENLSKELTQPGIEEENVRFFANLVSKFDKKLLSVGDTLLGVLRHPAKLLTLDAYTVQISYAIASANNNDDSGVLFPLVQLGFLASGREEKKEMYLHLDANELQSFLIELQESLDKLLKESDTFKRGLGNKYTTLIGD